FAVHLAGLRRHRWYFNPFEASLRNSKVPEKQCAPFLTFRKRAPISAGFNAGFRLEIPAKTKAPGPFFGKCGLTSPQSIYTLLRWHASARRDFHGDPNRRRPLPDIT